MSYANNLSEQIESVLDKLANEGKPLVRQWITHEVCNKHSKGLAENDSAYFWQYGGYCTVGDAVRRAINRRVGGKPEEAAKSLRLPGFDHLQDYYMVVRDGTEQGIPLAEMSDEEINAKADAYRVMGAGCFAHANELKRYKRERGRSAAA